MSEFFMGEIRLFPYTFAPRHWATCEGQLLSINQNQALFSLLGTMYGGNGVTTFALPDLRGRTLMSSGGAYSRGQLGGQESVQLVANQLPVHTHQLVAHDRRAAPETSPEPGPGKSLARAHAVPAGGGHVTVPHFASGPNGTMAPGTISSAGGNQPHENRQPFLVLTYCIALQGYYPSRS